MRGGTVAHASNITRQYSTSTTHHRTGSHSIICFALATYGIRMLWYSQITQTPKGALMFIPAELLHGITYSIFVSGEGRYRHALSHRPSASNPHVRPTMPPPRPQSRTQPRWSISPGWHRRAPRPPPKGCYAEYSKDWAARWVRWPADGASRARMDHRHRRQGPVFG